VLAQKDEALQKVASLQSEIEGLKDHNVQLMDRAANFKVQAQAKEVSACLDVRKLLFSSELKR
jgi:FtsZ-binding cell division protein ZapB